MFTKTVFDPKAQPPFRYGGLDCFDDCAGVFDDMRAKFGITVLTENPVIADLFGIEVIDFEKDDFDGRVAQVQEAGNCIFTLVTDNIDPEFSPWEDCLTQAVDSVQLGYPWDEIIEDRSRESDYAVLLVDLSRWPGFTKLNIREVLRILRKEIQRRIDQKAYTSMCVYNSRDRVVCQYKGDDRFEVWEAVQKDYPNP